MTVDVYYFSGTGNSLVVARDIAEKTHGKLISMPSIINKERIKTDADVIGVVFPLHGIFRVPSIVKRFVGKLDDISSKYVFAVITYGSMAGGVTKSFRSVVESCGGKLSAGFAVHMPMNNITIPFMYNGTVRDKEQKLFAEWHREVNFI
jgi:flavodoxin